MALAGGAAAAGLARRAQAAAPALPTPPPAAQWPEADVLFRRDRRWLGGDGAYSVPLNDGRILWLFGDTLVARTPQNTRAESALVHNTIAIQRGDDPTTAEMTFHWRGTASAPASFFPEEGGRWFWPVHGIRIGSALVLFLQRVRPTGGGLGFEIEGWQAAVIDNAAGDPEEWAIRMTAPGARVPPGITVGAALFRGDRIMALAQREGSDNAGYLVRWAESDFADGRIDRAQWWLGYRGWFLQEEVMRTGGPVPILANTGPGGSIHYDARRRKWLAIHSDRYGTSTIVWHTADRPEGPWSPQQVVFRPPESERPKTLVYGAKAHPALAAGEALAITYATNGPGDLATLIDNPALFYPRFVKLAR
jgi:hypothetical protein